MMKGIDPVDEPAVETLRRYTGKLAAVDAWIIVNKSRGRRTQADNFRLGRMMSEAGWERELRRFGGPPISTYVRGTPAEREMRLYVFLDPINGEVIVTHSTSSFNKGLTDKNIRIVD